MPGIADRLSFDTSVPPWLWKRVAAMLWLVWLAFLISLAPPLAAVAADWPQWRCDANRSGATAEPGPDRPRLLWRLDLRPVSYHGSRRTSLCIPTAGFHLVRSMQCAVPLPGSLRCEMQLKLCHRPHLRFPYWRQARG